MDVEEADEVEEEAESLANDDVDAEEESEVVVLEEDDEVVANETEVVGFGAAIAEPAAKAAATPTAAEDGVGVINEPTRTAADLIAQLIDGPTAPAGEIDVEPAGGVDIEPTEETELEATGDADIELAETAGEQGVDRAIDQQTDDIVLDVDLVEGNLDEAIAEFEVVDAEDADVVADPSDKPQEGPAAHDADFDWGEAATDELEPFAEPDTDGEPEISTGETIERLDAIFVEPSEAAEDLEAGDASDPAGDLPPAVVPDLPDLPDHDEPTDAEDSVPELDFDEATPVMPTPALDLDLPEADAENDQALEWDEEVVEPAAEHSSAGPLGERAAAALCDLLVLTAIGSALVGAASSGTGLPFRQILVEEALGLGIAWAIFVIGYSVFFVGSCGQTIGRMVMRLRVVGTDQFSVGFGRAAIRLAAWVVSALPLLAGMLPALRDPERRGLHDRLSRTRVVKA